MKKGFTLIEILISIAIIAVLTAIGIVSYVSINRNARDAKRRSDIEQLRSALELFRAEKGFYPSVGAGGWTDASSLNTTETDPDVGLVDEFIPAIPSDPQGTLPYRYRASSYSDTTGAYYGYCLEAYLENTSAAANTCSSIETNYNYGSKNP